MDISNVTDKERAIYRRSSKDDKRHVEATRRVATLKTERTTFWEFGKEKRCLATARSRILYMFSVGSTPPSHVLSPRADRVVIVEITVNVYISVDIIRGHLWKRWRRLKTSW